MLQPEQHEPEEAAVGGLPLRFQLQSHDKLCHVSMEIEWTDESGQRHTWSSWDDALGGFYTATKFLPVSSWDISVFFRTQPNRHRIARVDRRQKNRWVKGENELIRFRPSPANSPGSSWEEVDAWFEVAGPLTRTYVRRAWNARNARNAGSPAQWELWESFSKKRAALPPPSTMTLAIRQVWQADDGAERVELAMRRLRAASEALRITRQRLLVVLRDLDTRVTRQWFRVNSGNTVAASLAVASFGALCVAAPPIGVGLGIGSAAVGMGSLSKDVMGDHSKGNAFARAVYEDMYEQFGFDAVEAELNTVLASVDRQDSSAGKSTGKSRKVGSALAAAAQTTHLAMLCARGGLRAGRLAMTVRASQGVGAAGRVLGGFGSALAVAVCIHGWSTKKPMQKLIKEKITEAERSVEYLKSFEDQVDKAWTCSLCETPLGFGPESEPVVRCRHFHCFHAACLAKRQSSGSSSSCPLCKDAEADALKSIGESSERLTSLLRVLGLRAPSSIESVAPQLLEAGFRLANRLFERGAQWRDQGQQARDALLSELSHEDRLQQPKSLRRSRSAEELLEDLSPDVHESWQEAVQAAGSVAELPRAEVTRLLEQGKGMPLRYRHALWPLWTRVDQRRDEAAEEGCSFESWAKAELPGKVAEVIEADIPRTRSDFVKPAQYPELRQLLRAVSARSPQVGYAQGMNQIAAMLLKLGFQGDVAFWMLVAVLDDLLPGCHSPDLSGLFRDTAVTEVLLRSLLPRHGEVLPSAGMDLLLFVTADFFLTLGVKNAPLLLVARLWDVYFFSGPSGVFAGLVAQLELFLPVPAPSDKSQEECEEDVDGLSLLSLYREGAFMAGSRDAAMVVARAVEFLSEDPQRGIPSHLVAELRDSMEQLPKDESKSSLVSPADSTSTAAPPTCCASDEDSPRDESEVEEGDNLG